MKHLLIPPKQQRSFIVRWLAFLSIFPACTTSSSSSASSVYNIYNYDQAACHFTPDGRLLQVEYAMAASDQSTPLMVCQLDADTTCVMACSFSNSVGDNTKRVAVRRQDRIVVLENRMVVAMSGLLPDSVALLKAAIEKWQEYTMDFGDDIVERDYDKFSPTMGTHSGHMLPFIANAMGKECHGRCFQGGIRPYGSTMLVLGLQQQPIIDDSKGDESPAVQILQTDPSGAVVRVPVKHSTLPPTSGEQEGEADTNKNYGDLQLVKLIGGGSEIQLKIQKAIQRYSDNQLRRASSAAMTTPTNNKAKAKENITWEQLQALARILIEEQQEPSSLSSSSSYASSLYSLGNTAKAFFQKTTRLLRDAGGTSEEDSDKADDDQKSIAANEEAKEEQRRQPWIEAVILSRKLGIHRLTNAQIKQLLEY